MQRRRYRAVVVVTTVMLALAGIAFGYNLTLYGGRRQARVSVALIAREVPRTTSYRVTACRSAGGAVQCAYDLSDPRAVGRDDHVQRQRSRTWRIQARAASRSPRPAAETHQQLPGARTLRAQGSRPGGARELTWRTGWMNSPSRPRSAACRGGE